MLVLSVCPFVKQIGLIMRSKIKYYKTLAKNGITGNYLGFWGHYTAFSCFIYKNFLFAITAYFLPFPDKNLWFSSQRRREGVVGDANGSISK